MDSMNYRRRGHRKIRYKLWDGTKAICSLILLIVHIMLLFDIAFTKINVIYSIRSMVYIDIALYGFLFFYNLNRFFYRRVELNVG